MSVTPENEVAADVVEPTDTGGGAPTVELGLVVTPVLDESVVEALDEQVARLLAERYPGLIWKVTAVRDSLLTPPAPLSDVVDAARARLLDEDWDLVVYVTELPFRIARRPLLTHSSPTHGAALISLPALGLMQTSRLAELIADTVGVLAGDSVERGDQEDSGRQGRVNRRLVQLATDVEGAQSLEGIALLPRVVSGNLRLLAGMVRANHPWRLVTRLSRALVAALGVAAFGLVTSDVWNLASDLSAGRLVAICVLTIGVAVVTLIAVHGLWERARDRRVREQAILFNVVTVITLVLGIVVLYLEVFVLTLAAAALLIEPSLMSARIGHPSDAADYVRLAMLASALATVAGGLGGALESDAAVREATYGYRGGSRAVADGPAKPGGPVRG
jgi:uncharacterized membrane protein